MEDVEDVEDVGDMEDMEDVGDVGDVEDYGVFRVSRSSMSRVLHLPPTSSLVRRWIVTVCAALILNGALAALSAAPVLKVLFVGDAGPHKPAERLRDIGPVLLSRGIQLVYTEDVASVSLDNLRRYDALLVSTELESLPRGQASAIVDYVAQGGGLVALHRASGGFLNNEKYAALVGAQLQPATYEPVTIKTMIIAPAHPVMQGFTGFESVDEPLIHTRPNAQNRTVLEQRDQEPWTWVRAEGKGRVFYTAWGHDQRTWANPGFQDLIERGIRFAAGQQLPAALADRPGVAPLELYNQPGVPYYPPGQGRVGDGPWPQAQQPLSAADSMQHLVVPAGFEVQLVASDPDIKKPIAMQWDERGRLWIAESLDYPNRLLGPGEPGRDRLVICEDTNRDGRMDKFTVFAEGLNIPTGFTFSHGGVIVHQAPTTLFLKDTDGNDRADVREVLLRGWGRRDTHAGPNNLVYGFDNWIWGMLGYSGFEGTVGGTAHTFRQGFYRFRADGSQLEYLRSTNNNTWGIGFSEEGIAFGSTANNNPSVYLPIANRHYGPAGLEAKALPAIADTPRFIALTSRVRQVDVHWGYTSAAGHALYTARSYPKEYWNRVAFVADPTGHLVGQFNLERRGAEFSSNNPTNLIVSDDEWFAPIMAEVGPDGAVWIIDWYNYIVQHNPTPKGFTTGPGNAYQNELRDQRFGRIYRIVWKDGKPTPTPTLANAKPAQLVAALANENLLWRRHAQRLLVERGRKDVVPALLELVSNSQVDEIGFNVGAIHALWTLEGLNTLDTDPAALAANVSALRHPAAGVRRTAATVLPRSAASANALVKTDLLRDTDDQVRLACLLAFADCPPTTSVGTALHEWLGSVSALDRWLLDAAKMAATTHRVSLLAAASDAEIAAAANASSPLGTVLHHVTGRAGASATTAAPLADHRVLLKLGVVPDLMKYDRTELTVAAGKPVRLVFANPDHMPHNALLLRPGTIEAVGALSDAMLTDPQAIAKGYRPKTNDVLEGTPLVNPGESAELLFTAPTAPGRYPIICTFPGHWRLMQATLVVTP